MTAADPPFEVPMDRVVVSNHPADCDQWILDNVWGSEDTCDRVVGVDCEWRPAFAKNVTPKVSIVQLAASSSCLVFRLAHCKRLPMVGDFFFFFVLVVSVLSLP